MQPLCNEQGQLSLDQVAQSHVQLDLGCFQGWDIYHSSGKLFPVFHHPHCKIFFLISSLNCSLKPLQTLLICLSLYFLEGR